MKTILLIFPHQLFLDHPGFAEKPDEIVLIEDSLFFGDAIYPAHFHKQKLIFHRASMKYYEELCKQSIKTSYFDYQYKKTHLKSIIKTFSPAEFLVADPTDFILLKRLQRFITETNSELRILTNPGFINSREDNQTYREGKKRWFMADYYQKQRQRLNILIEKGKPIGGKWSFDEDNRKKLPKKMIAELPSAPTENNNKYIQSAKEYVGEKFATNPGNIEQFIYPTTHKEAEDWLNNFLKLKLDKFGPYEDAIVPDQSWLYHSVLTPALNTGLLTPQQVINKTLQHAKRKEVPLASLEGFIRQIIGWREFMRATYEDLGVKMRTTNHWQHERKIPNSFYSGKTGIEPIDNTIRRINNNAYCHHIERLMVLGGFMFICEFHPDEIYRWFMELFIDSYDWVMVPNVYAMSQNADGGLITTKPYFSGSSYVKKMSHYKQGPWCDIWDGLYWRFIIKHADNLQKNPRWAMMVSMANKMNKEKKAQHLMNAESYLHQLAS
ncbi:MAG: cryptochrome/photolyase family protein [Pseudomonadota bacterium]